MCIIIKYVLKYTYILKNLLGLTSVAKYPISPRCQHHPPLQTTMASDINITPTSSIVHNLSEMEMIVGWSIVVVLKSSNTHLINFSLSYLCLWAMGCIPPHINAVLSVSPSPIFLLFNALPSCRAIYCNEHPQPIQDRHFVLLSWSNQYILQLP